jgi:hypothetical protein
MSPKSWQILLESVFEAETIEMSCPECFELLDQYVELILDGTNPVEVLPMVKQHLEHCRCCTNEFEALMVMLQQATP